MSDKSEMMFDKHVAMSIKLAELSDKCTRRFTLSDLLKIEFANNPGLSDKRSWLFHKYRDLSDTNTRSLSQAYATLHKQNSFLFTSNFLHPLTEADTSSRVFVIN